MPIKFQIQTQTIEQKIDAIRHSLKPDEGMDMKELAEKIGRTTYSARRICQQKKWSALIYCPASRNEVWLLVHPNTLAKYAAKS